MSAAAPISLSSSDVEFEDPKQSPAATSVPQLSSSDVEFEQPKDAAQPEEKPGLLERAYETSGLKGLVDSAKQKSQEDEDVGTQAMEHLKAGRIGHAAELVLGHLAKRGGEGAMGPAGDLIKGSAVNAYQHGSKAVEAAGQGNVPEAVAQGAEAIPVVGPIAEQVGEPLGKDIREGNYPGVAGDVVGGASSILGLKGAAEGFDSGGIPKTQTIADTELPLTVGQGRELQNPETGGKIIKPLEDMARPMPGGGNLREVAREQQAGAREILAGKAAKTGAEVSSAPEDIEQNYANAVEKTRQEGSAKYEAIAQAAKDADLPAATDAAAEILSDPDTVKILPNSARNALSKIGSAASELDGISRQIYGRPASTLDAEELANVKKAQGTAPGANFPSISGGAMKAVMDARSELADAAHGMKDPADRYLVGKALDKFDDGVKTALEAHDKVNGSNLAGDLQDAKQLWTQKYAFDNFRKGLQQVMRGTPSEGPREINGSAFQRLVNKLDPQGGLPNRTSILQRMFPDDPQSVKDIHDLADFMGKNQSHAGGGMGGNMARMRMLGLKQSAAGLLTNIAGFSSIMARRGMANALLQVLRAGKDTVKASAGIAALNAAADQTDGDRNADIARSTGQVTTNTTKDATAPNTLPTDKNNVATAPSALTTPPTTSAIPNTDATTAAQNSTTPAANSNPNATAQQVTTQSTPPLVPGSVTNETRNQPPDPRQAQAADSANNAGRMQEEEAQAHRMASGLPPVPPAPPMAAPPPPPPGVVSPDMVAAMGKKIAGMPPEQRAQATSEAHHELSQALLQQGKVSGPDGKIEIITKPEQADKIAQRIINEELGKQDKVLAEANNPGQKPAGAATTPAPASRQPSWKVVSTAPSQPPADLWKGKESKRLTLRDSAGKTSRWELVKGVPKMVD